MTKSKLTNLQSNNDEYGAKDMPAANHSARTLLASFATVFDCKGALKWRYAKEATKGIFDDAGAILAVMGHLRIDAESANSLRDWYNQNHTEFSPLTRALLTYINLNLSKDLSSYGDGFFPDQLSANYSLPEGLIGERFKTLILLIATITYKQIESDTTPRTRDTFNLQAVVGEMATRCGNIFHGNPPPAHPMVVLLALITHKKITELNDVFATFNGSSNVKATLMLAAVCTKTSVEEIKSVYQSLGSMREPARQVLTLSVVLSTNGLAEMDERNTQLGVLDLLLLANMTEFIAPDSSFAPRYPYRR